jgi:peptide/nickel transport system ATP-binding protein
VNALLEIRDLTVRYGDTTAVNGASLTVERGDVVGIVGESGSGKTTLGTTILGLLPDAAEVTGDVRFQGRDLRTLPARESRKLRGAEIAAVFQNPATALDPAYTIGHQIVEVFRAHRKIARREARAEAVRLLTEVGIPAPEERMKSHPHELSGGMH